MFHRLNAQRFWMIEQSLIDSSWQLVQGLLLGINYTSNPIEKVYRCKIQTLPHRWAGKSYNFKMNDDKIEDRMTQSN